MVNGCWSTHSSLAQTHSPANPAREIPYVFLRPKRIPRNRYPDGYPWIRSYGFSQITTRWQTRARILCDKWSRRGSVSGHAIARRSNGGALENTPRVSFDTLDYQTFLWSSPSMLVTSNLRSPPRFHGFDKGSGYFSFSQLPREMCSVCLGSKIR